MKVCRLQRREGDALARFYELVFERVYAYIRRMLGEEHQAEDLTQDVFMHLQRSFATYDPARELGPWVFTIASNKVRDHWRSRQSQSARRVSSLDDEENLTEPVAQERGPLPKLENEELKAELEAAIAALPEISRATLVLRLHEGLSFEEIARMFERNETAVRKRYSRALAELRTALEKKRIGFAGGGSA